MTVAGQWQQNLNKFMACADNLDPFCPTSFRIISQIANVLIGIDLEPINFDDFLGD